LLLLLLPCSEAEQTRKVRKSQKRKLELLSFGDEAEAEEADAVAAAAAAPRIKCVTGAGTHCSKQYDLCNNN
jgi:hypothetical protein